MPAYIGVDGKAKQIYKVYQGDENGIAHLIWAPPGVYKPTSDLTYPQLGTTRALIYGNGQGSASTKHHCHFFANTSSNLNSVYRYYVTVDTYDEDLVLTDSDTPFYLYDQWLDNFNCDSGAGTVYDDDGNSFAIFAYGNCKVTDDALMINDDCTVTSLYAEGYGGNVFGSYSDGASSTCFASGATMHNFIVAGGHLKNSVNTYSNHVYTVSYEGVPTADPCTLTTARAECTGVSINGAFIVVGGSSKATSAPPIEIITDDLTISVGSGYTDRENMCSTTIPDRFAILGCGESTDDLSTIIIDKSFTVSTGPSLSTMRRQATALNVGDYAIFAGGRSIDNKYGLDTVDVIDANLTRTNPENMLSQIVFGAIPGKVGKWGILYGGITHDGSSYDWNTNNPEVFYSFE